MMVRDNYLYFEENSQMITKEMLFPHIRNTFTIEFWAKPEAIQKISAESASGIFQVTNQPFVITPVFGAYPTGDNKRAGIGISVGKNGVSVYEHTINHLTSPLVFSGALEGWNHIAVVYDNKKPSIYINSMLMKTGLPSRIPTLVPSSLFGGDRTFGYYKGSLKDIRIWNVARTQNEIAENMNQELTGNEVKLMAYWKLDEGTGNLAHDLTKNNNHGNLTGAKWIAGETTKITDKNINVLFTFFIPSGGVETLNRQRFYALSQIGINCHFLYTQEGTGLQNKINTSVFVTNNDTQIRDIINEGDYTAIVVGSDLVMLQRLRKMGFKGLLIYEIQGLGFNKEYAEKFLKEEAYPIISDNSFCDGILYPKTPHLISAFEKYFPNKPRFCFHNCFNTEEFSYVKLPKKDVPIVGWVGRLEENKNWKDFLLIGAQLLKVNPSIQLWMFEDNTLSTKKERIAFEKKFFELNLKSHLTIYANQPHSKMAEHFSTIGDSGGFLCSTSKVEGFGYAVLEAMVCKCPVISTDSDGVRSFITHNVTGKFFELGNIDQAVKEAHEILSNASLRESIREKAVEHIETQFSPEEYAKNFLNMITKLQQNCN